MELNIFKKRGGGDRGIKSEPLTPKPHITPTVDTLPRRGIVIQSDVAADGKPGRIVINGVESFAVRDGFLYGYTLLPSAIMVMPAAGVALAYVEPVND